MTTMLKDVTGCALRLFVALTSVLSLSDLVLRHRVMTSARQTAPAQPLLQDYCQWEAFNASCPTGHVVVMESAQFGRMRLSRCADTDVYIGCAADVLPLIDARCSGRPSCLVQLPDPSLHQQQACPKDLVAYLEASYSCFDVGPIDPDVCINHPTNSQRRVADAPTTQAGSSSTTSSSFTGYLASYYAQTIGQGRPTCPWIIAVEPGQRIQLSLIDFSSATRYRVDSSPTGTKTGSASARYAEIAYDSELGQAAVAADYCYVYATVVEDNKPTTAVRRFTICAEESRNEQIVYTSVSNAVTIEVTDAVIADMSINFIIKYTAVGCADIKPPTNAHVERNGDRVTITCNTTSQSWHLVCKGTTWIGPRTHDCREGSPVGEKVTEDPPFPTYGLVIAVVIGVVVGSVCGFLLLALVLSCRRRSRRHPLSMAGEIPLNMATNGDSATEHVCKFHGLATTSGGGGGAGEYGYTHVWQLQQHGRPSLLVSGAELSLDSAYHTTTTGSITGQDLDLSAAVLGNTTLDGVATVRRTPRRDHLYECPLFNERSLLNRFPSVVSQNSGSTHVCHHHHQSHYQLERTHHPLCPLGHQHQQQQQQPAASSVERDSFAITVQPTASSSSATLPTTAAQQLQQQPVNDAIVSSSIATAVSDVVTDQKRTPAARRAVRGAADCDESMAIAGTGLSATTGTGSGLHVTSSAVPAPGSRSANEPDLTHRLKAENHYL